MDKTESTFKKVKKQDKIITVCWQCKRDNMPLTNIKDLDGKKTQDYICRGCQELYGMKKPPIANSSWVRIKV